MQPPPKGATDFAIVAPVNGSILGPTFSVNGGGPQNMTNINVTVGSTSRPATQLPGNNGWEAIFTGMASGTNLAVSATSSSGNATPAGITVNIDAAPGILVGPVTPPMPMADAVGSPQANPWIGWKVTGSYNPAIIKKIWIYLTHKGNNVNDSGNTAWGEATLGTNGPDTWSCELGFVPQGYRGNGFRLHYNAHRLADNVIVHGTIPNFFNGPT